jgi:hypothetical protein
MRNTSKGIFYFGAVTMLGLLEKFTSLSQFIGQSALQNIDSDQILLMNDISWEIYETLLQNLHDNSHYRLKYLAGTLEIMSPSRRHEFDKKIIALLLETYFLELDIDFYPLGSTIQECPFARNQQVLNNSHLANLS